MDRNTQHKPKTSIWVYVVIILIMFLFLDNADGNDLVDIFIQHVLMGSK